MEHTFEAEAALLYWMGAEILAMPTWSQYR